MIFATPHRGRIVSQDEQMEIRVKLAIELRDAQSDLTLLQEKALQLADRLDLVSRKIRRNAAFQPSKNDFSSEFDMSNMLEEHDRAALNSNDVGKLTDDLKIARQRVFNLIFRKEQIDHGNSSTMTV
jgi:hypothetical protein